MMSAPNQRFSWGDTRQITMDKNKYIDLELDASGLNAPLPVLRAKKALNNAESGSTLLVIFTDSITPKQFEEFAKQTGHTLLNNIERNEKYYATLMKDGDKILKEGAQVLTFTITNDRKIKVGLKQTDGTIVYAERATLLSGIYFPIFNEWSERIRELEEMINNPNVSEQDLQSFFEHHPELLQGNEFDAIIPQAIIEHDESSSIRDAWKADFVLAPRDEESFCKVIELKKPDARIFRSEKANHSRPYRSLIDAINQIKDYGKAFRGNQVRKQFQDRYGIEVFMPTLQLIYGRKRDIQNIRKIQELQRESGVEIKTWDAAVEIFRQQLA